MLDLTTRVSTNTNQLQIHIPDELKGMELQVIILPADKGSDKVDFFTDEELSSLSHAYHGTLPGDNEDYSKW